MTWFQWALRATAAAMLAAAACHAVLGLGAEQWLDPDLPAAVLHQASLDSQNRFYGTMFGATGAVLWICALDPARYDRVIRCLLWGFLAAGLARLGAVWQGGWPSATITVLGAVELLGAPAMLAWHHRLRPGR